MTLLLALSSFSGCDVISSLKSTDTTDSGVQQANVETAEDSTAENSTNISTGYILLGDGEEYTELYSSSTDGSVIARMYADEPITVYSIDSDWANVSYGGMMGYVELQYISFSKPQAKEDTTQKETESKSEETEKETESAKDDTSNNSSSDDSDSGVEVNNQINQNIEQSVNIVLVSDKDGFEYAEPTYYPAYVSDNRDAWCSAQSIYIYSQPDTSSYKREANMLYYGDTLTILGSVNGWYYIATDSGNGYDLHGYVKQSYITIGQTPVSPEPVNATYGRVSVSSANVRSSPNKETNSNVLFTVYQGAEFEVLDYDGYWYKINYNGTICYISHKMVEVW
jgi:uncharacterized protein YgiM (DUF1202 family)